ncbi:unnamed protein product [Effrenium voratum]|uniref:Uncharacterized protein n=1 Tax=Effrenium voratum TaxID=2562239 RepID=A0AA36IWW4_9DINO|nr:unnamed protein product [Effrenium voratum]
MLAPDDAELEEELAAKAVVELCTLAPQLGVPQRAGGINLAKAQLADSVLQKLTEQEPIPEPAAREPEPAAQAGDDLQVQASGRASEPDSAARVLAAARVADWSGQVENVLIGGERLAVLAKVGDEQQVAKLIEEKGAQALCFKGEKHLVTCHQEVFPYAAIQNAKPFAVEAFCHFKSCHLFSMSVPAHVTADDGPECREHGLDIDTECNATSATNAAADSHGNGAVTGVSSQQRRTSHSHNGCSAQSGKVLPKYGFEGSPTGVFDMMQQFERGEVLRSEDFQRQGWQLNQLLFSEAEPEKGGVQSTHATRARSAALREEEVEVTVKLAVGEESKVKVTVKSSATIQDVQEALAERLGRPEILKSCQRNFLVLGVDNLEGIARTCQWQISMLQSVSSLLRVVCSCAGALQSSNLEHLGVHPSNRDGLGVNAGDVRDLLDSIATVGILPERVNRVAVEIKGDRVRQFNSTLVAFAGSALDQLEPALLKAAALRGAQTNFVLRNCVHARHPSIRKLLKNFLNSFACFSSTAIPHWRGGIQVL